MSARSFSIVCILSVAIAANAQVPPPRQPDLFAVGSGNGSELLVFDIPSIGKPIARVMPYDAGFRGGVNVAVGDVNGDGLSDIITAPAVSGGPHVKVFDGLTMRQGNALPAVQFFAYDTAFRGGVNVAAGDVNGDGVDEIITGAGASPPTTTGGGGGPHVKVFDGNNGAVLRSFFAFEPAFKGGVRVATGDVNGDGIADIVTGAGPGGGPHVKVFSGVDSSVVASFFPYDAAFKGGVYVAAGDVNGDGRADIVTGPGSSSRRGESAGPVVRVYALPVRANDVELQSSFFAYDPAFRGGVTVAVGDPFHVGPPGSVLTGPSSYSTEKMKLFRGAGLPLILEEYGFGGLKFFPGQTPATLPH